MNDTGNTHDQLVLAFIEYFKDNEKWETKPWDVPGVRARNALSKIRHLALKRRKEIQRQRKVRRQEKRNGQQKQK